jgi:hypothetical protein
MAAGDRRSEKTCFHCGNKIEGRYKLIPIEKPYGNVFFDIDCAKNVEIDGENAYFTANFDKLIEYLGLNRS